MIEKINIDKELYLSLTLDRAGGCPVFIYSPEGGMSIEDVAHETPEKIFKLKSALQCFFVSATHTLRAAISMFPPS